MPPGRSWVLPWCVLGASWVLLGASWALPVLPGRLDAWMPPGSPLFLDGPWVASAGERPPFRLCGFFVLSKRMANKLQKVVQNGVQFGFKMLEIRLGTAFFIFQIDFISEGFVFSFLMLSGRVESMKLARKPCRVSQNRGSAVSLLIRIFVQKALKIASPMASKIIDNPKTPHPWSLRKRTHFLVGISNTFQ